MNNYDLHKKTPHYINRRNYSNWYAITDKNGELTGYKYIDPDDTSFTETVPISSYKLIMGIGKGGSRRRTVYRMHKSHRKSKRVRHTRRKQTRRHRHTRRR